MDGSESLAAFAQRLRALKGMAAKVAAEAAPGIERVLRKTAAAGTSPEGVPWKPTKDGGRALVHAADAITVKAIGTVVQAVVRGVAFFHNAGTSRVPARPILPSAGLTPAMRAELVAAARRVFGRTMGGG